LYVSIEAADVSFRCVLTFVFSVLYGFSISYIAGPVFGMPFDTAAIVNLVQALPSWFVLTGKGLIAASFAFHSFNGLRHLGWDMGRCE
jgi:succinate dehydrogenase (ubiquinone) cytochrome b560 subunit